MLSEAYSDYNEMMRQIRKERAAQYAVVEEDGLYVYSRPVRFVKEPSKKNSKSG